MKDNENFGFSKFVPGFDFLQSLAKGASQTLPQMPSLSNWIAPTLDPEELDKRIGELKAVHFWLDQNSKALGATIQALEVQKMTLATLKGMNFNMAEVANALKLKPVGTAAPRTAPPQASAPKASVPRPDGAGANGIVDPLQWWGALTQQFQQIAATAMKDTAAQAALDSAKNMATGVAKEAIKTATGMAKSATGSAVGARRAAAKRPAKKAAR
jgi:hypothetical protein